MLLTVDGESIPTCPRCGRAVDAEDQAEAARKPHYPRPGLDRDTPLCRPSFRVVDTASAPAY